MKLGLTYGDVITQLKTYVQNRQKGKKFRKEEGQGTQENSVVLKTKTEERPGRCDYCNAKGWEELKLNPSTFKERNERRKEEGQKGEEGWDR